MITYFVTLRCKRLKNAKEFTTEYLKVKIKSDICLSCGFDKDCPVKEIVHQHFRENNHEKNVEMAESQ